MNEKVNLARTRAYPERIEHGSISSTNGIRRILMPYFSAISDIHSDDEPKRLTGETECHFESTWSNVGYEGLRRDFRFEQPTKSNPFALFTMEFGAEDSENKPRVSVAYDNEKDKVYVALSWKNNSKDSVKKLLNQDSVLSNLLDSQSSDDSLQDGAIVIEVSDLSTNPITKVHSNGEFGVTELSRIEEGEDQSEVANELTTSILSLIPIKTDEDGNKVFFDPNESLVHHDLQTYLLNGTLSAYDMVNYCRDNPELVAEGLRASVISHESPYVRLCSAWSLGEIGNPEDLPLLQQAYAQEKEDNTRTNIAWAEFMVAPEQIDKEKFNEFLLDDYYVIPLVAVKRLSGIPHLVGEYEFSDYYDTQDNQLVRLEKLRNIRSFRIPKDINAKLDSELRTTEHILEKSEIIQAIGATNQVDSMGRLMNYYQECKGDILEDAMMSHAMVNAIFSLGQSDGYGIMHEIYQHQDSHIIRWKIVESLATAGGPKSLSVLRSIYDLEQDQTIKDTVKAFIDMTRITTN